MKRDFLLFATFFVLAIILLQAVIFISFFNDSQDKIFEGKATSGAFSTCFGYSPEINLSNCPSVINQSTTIENNTMICEIILSHRLDHNVTMYTNVSSYFNVEGLTLEIESNGSLLLDGSQKSVGQQNISLMAFDNHPECNFSTEEYYEVEILDINDPPHLKEKLPTVRVLEGGEARPFFLNTYFDDVDVKPEWGTPLKYSFMFAEGSNKKFTITIDNVTSQVIIKSPIGNCETDIIIFEAEDRGGLTVNSNPVEIISVCFDDEPEPGTDMPSFPQICESEWVCEEWSRCFINETQYRKCVDLHRCDSNDYEKKFWRECEYEEPEEPEEEEIEPDPDATCYDGIQNCHLMPDGTTLCEEGIDCGGPCDPCRRIETPGIIFDEEADNLILFMALIMVLITASVFTYFIFRRQILSFFARISWWLTRKKRKQFLLKPEEKQLLLKNINTLYEELRKSDNKEFNGKDKLLLKIINVSRQYLSSALKINYDFDFERVKKGINKKIINDSLQQGMSLYSESLFPKERRKATINKQDLMNFTQETRMLILNTSKLTKTDFNFKALNIEPKGTSFEKSQILIHNSFLALCFSEAINAKKNYYELLKLYENMNDEEKTKSYYELAKIYHYVKTILSWI